MAGAVAVCAWMGLGWSLLLMLLLTCGALVLWPALHAESMTEPAAPPARSGGEREKVLSLLEAGKITAEESAELLNALGAHGPAPECPRAPMTSARRLVLAGAGLVLIGFLLPWFSFSPAAELTGMMHEFRTAAGFPAPEGTVSVRGQTFHVRGGNIAHGLGWVVLALGLASALLPYIAPAMERGTQRTFRWLALGAGGIVLLYLLSQDLRLVAAGLVLTILGYACEALGTFREDRPALPRPAAPVEAGA